MIPPRSFIAFLNDPGSKDDRPELCEVGKNAARFSIPGLPMNGELDKLEPGTIEFEASHLTLILTATYDMWANYFGADFDWEPGRVLPVVPRAGRDLNAYYDRRALKFFYSKDFTGKRTLYSCESSDVASHECGHAVLDAHHPDYWSSFHPETGAFHEAFGDMTALLTTLQFPTVRAMMLKETGGDLRKSNNVSRLAEQLGKELYAQFGKNASGATFLRDLVNHFRYTETWNLPANAPATRLSSESHSFSRVFSGAFYQILVGIYELKRKADAKLSADDALVQARDDAGNLLATALDLAPPGNAIYRVIATAFIKADQHLNAGNYFELLRKVFSRRRILMAKDANQFKPHTKTIGTRTTPVRLGTLSMTGTPNEPLSPSELQAALHLGPNDVVVSRQMNAADDEKVVQYQARRMMPLRGKQFGPADGALVPVQGGLTLNVDEDGSVAASGSYRAGLEDVRAIRDHVQKLAAKDRIYDARPGDATDMMHLISLQKPYYIDYDAAGNKILRRAFIACH